MVEGLKTQTLSQVLKFKDLRSSPWNKFSTFSGTDDQIRIESKSTLIVAPDHIWQQWKEELQTHLAFKTLDVLLYAGMEAPVTPVELGNRMNTGTLAQSRTNPYAPRTRVTARSSKSTANGEPEVDELLPGFVQPGQLACADIVLTSYSVVQRELDWAEVVAERQAGLGDRPRLRLAQRYLCRPSPLTCVRWWRNTLPPFGCTCKS
ncbi:hypothetical protein X801_09990 [Opisthorchis viverrini]|uniref:SNF2 N-terminal domain-containing protein n=1 Tax=Opisthorchis viverrini TaxID=6198 RepID=A0A1S8WIG0_OPIVI|nr:hypothetical protein X801_09990 [Opisthorchis viverrini]